MAKKESSKRNEVLKLLREGKYTTEEILQRTSVTEYYFRSIIYNLRQFSDCKIYQKAIWILEDNDSQS